MARKPFEKVKVAFEFETCKECPKVRSERTPQAGCADDYYCTEARDITTGKHRMVMGYVEYSSDENPIPEWCPRRV